MKRVSAVLRMHPEAIRFYLCEMVFPVCMKQQRIKLSASGQELGSDMLFRYVVNDLVPHTLAVHQ
jgi:hypothetical protein